MHDYIIHALKSLQTNIAINRIKSVKGTKFSIQTNVAINSISTKIICSLNRTEGRNLNDTW